MMFQPANSPDTNVLDLALFWVLSREYLKAKMDSLDQLHLRMLEVFAKYSAWKIEKAFLTLQSVMNETLDTFGGNPYKLPHMGKELLLFTNNLPSRLQVSASAK